MANLIPVVTPGNNDEGVTIDTQTTILFDKAMEADTINASTCFIVEIPTHNLSDLDSYISESSFGDIVQSLVSIRRVDPATNLPSNIVDHGDDANSGEKYKTLITVKPNSPLKPNTTYAGLISKDISLISVFDPKANTGNSGNGILLAKGAYDGLRSDLYTITIGGSGDVNHAKYMWTRASDGRSSSLLTARNRFMEIDRGIKVKFEEGQYTIGDSFTIIVHPLDSQSEIFSWTFSTGAAGYNTPEDESSNSIINLPVNNPGTNNNQSSLQILDIQPDYGTSMMKVPRKANIKIGKTIFQTKEYTSQFNNYEIAIIDGGSEQIAINGTKIEIQINEGITTSLDVVNLFNNSNLVNQDFIAESESENEIQITSSYKQFSEGVDNINIRIEFNKEIDPNLVEEYISISSRNIFPAQQVKNIPYSYTINGNILTLIPKA